MLQITVRHVHTFDPPFDCAAALKRLEELVSVLGDKIAELNSHIDAAATRVQTDVADLKAQIAALQARIDAGSATPEELAALDAALTKLDQIDPTTPSVLPPEPATV